MLPVIPTGAWVLSWIVKKKKKRKEWFVSIGSMMTKFYISIVIGETNEIWRCYDKNK